MRTVQLDKNSGSKKLCKLCNEQGLVRCFLLQQEHRDVDDPTVAELAIGHGNLMVTFDRTFCVEAAATLAGRNPGVLLLREDDQSMRQMNSKTAPKHLDRIKKDLPDWHEIPWQNSIIEVTPSFVQIYHTTADPPVSVGRFERDSDGWQIRVRELLASNASMIAIEPPPS